MFRFILNCLGLVTRKDYEDLEGYCKYLQRLQRNTEAALARELEGFNSFVRILPQDIYTDPPTKNDEVQA